MLQGITASKWPQSSPTDARQMHCNATNRQTDNQTERESDRERQREGEGERKPFWPGLQ